MLRNLVAQNRQNFDSHFALGKLYDSAGRPDLALPLLNKAFRLRPDSFDAALALGIVERHQGLLAEALRHLRKAVALSADSVAGHAVLGSVHLDRHEIDAAISSFNRALTLQPHDAELSTKLASLFVNQGDVIKADVCFRQALAANSLCGDAYYGLASLPQSADGAGDIERMQLALDNPELQDADRVLIGFALGRVFERSLDFDRAFEHIHEANRLQRQAITYSTDEQRAMFDRHQQALGKDFVEHCRSHSIADDTAILVLGMPRSGTSLVEQILASHPLVHGAGEVEYSRLFVEGIRKLTGQPFPQDIDSIAPEVLVGLASDYVDRLKSASGTAVHVVDKLPHNFLRICLFAATLPNTKIILCERDPLDNCVSIYKHHFSNDHGYATDLKELGEYYGLYRKLMSHWYDLLPGVIHRINYEQLVDDPDAQVRRLLNYCKLPFDAACLSFHRTRRTVNTPSALQVRDPIHNKSIGSASRYAAHIVSLVEALG
jgi:tetratricopeptide (TPR) repeat protein